MAGRTGIGTRTPLAASGDQAGTSPAAARRRSRNPWMARLESPLAAYYLVLGSTVALATIGLVMVLSSSSVTSLKVNHSSYTIFAKQAMFAAAAIPVAWVASRVPRRVWTALAWPLLVVGFAGLLLVFTPLGISVQGNRNWISVAGFTLQPSEAAKLALVVWGAAVLERKRPMFDRLPHILVPVVPVAGLMLALVLFGNDLGTAMIMMCIVGTLLFVAGAPLRVFALTAGAALAATFLLVTTSANRMHRVQEWLGGGSDNSLSTGWQTLHGKWALATGGWWGVGLGASRQKWSWLPEAHNDFIFAIIGEELGLAGTLAVLALFALLGFGLFRLVLASDDMFVKVATGGVLVWVLGQAVVNVGSVLGVFPVIGVPLPLVSSGGSALMTTLIALGMVLGFARRVPGAPEALASRPGVVRRSLAVLPGARPLPGTRHRSGR
ncbi:MAG TPA: putative lipid II flippase FtsW [Kineosporiaceae bacterium]|nr:putative lipid II flippase FtsW [Kineosporiaceae bacterium]